VTTHTRSGALSSSSSFCWSMAVVVFGECKEGGRGGAEGRDLNWVVGTCWVARSHLGCRALRSLRIAVRRGYIRRSRLVGGDTSKNAPFEHAVPNGVWGGSIYALAIGTRISSFGSMEGRLVRAGEPVQPDGCNWYSS
jgi:hypothetical protein